MKVDDSSRKSGNPAEAFVFVLRALGGTGGSLPFLISTSVHPARNFASSHLVVYPGPGLIQLVRFL